MKSLQITFLVLVFQCCRPGMQQDIIVHCSFKENLKIARCACVLLLARNREIVLRPENIYKETHFYCNCSFLSSHYRSSIVYSHFAV